jgi:hypothetical protein
MFTISLIATACATVSDKPAVRVTADRSEVTACRTLGFVSGNGAVGTSFLTYDFALEDLQRSAARIGADTVLIVNQSSTPKSSSSVTMFYSGEAYRCAP